MGIPARTNNYGQTNYNQSFVITTTKILVNGSSSYSQAGVNPGVHSCRRYNHTNNPPHQIGSTSTKFRSPSSYERSVQRNTPVSGIWLDDSFTGTSPTSIDKIYVEGVPNQKASNAMLAAYPLFSGQLPLVYDDNLLNQAKTECLLKLGDMKAALGENLATAAQTADLLADTTINLLQGLKALRKGDIGYLKQKGLGFVRNPKKWSDLYLQYSYGWKPMIQDIYGTYQLFQEQMEPALIVKAQRTVESYASAKPTTNLQSTWESQGGVRGQHRCQLWGQLDDYYKHVVQQAGLANPLSIAWEVVPYSFVLDWALPIGNVLNALTATRGLSFVGGFVSLHAEGHIEATLIPSGNYQELSRRGVDCDVFFYKRTKLTDFPTPLPYAKSPFSTTHVLKAIALFTSRIFK